MATLTNRSIRALVVRDGDERREIAPGAAVEVRGGDWSSHLFVKAGWLHAASPEPDAPENDPGPESDGKTGEATTEADQAPAEQPAPEQAEEAAEAPAEADKPKRNKRGA